MTRKGWIIISVVAVLVVLLIAGAIYYSKNPDAWPMSDRDADEVQVIKRTDEDGDKHFRIAGKKDFVDEAAKTVFPPKDDISNNIPSDYAYDATGKTGYTSWTQEVKIGLIIAENEYDVKNVISGTCGDVYMVTYRVPGPSVLANSIRALFGDKVFGDFLPGNIIPSYHPNLSFRSVAIDNGVAKIYLNGTFSGSYDGMCDAELAIAQLSQTALSFASVNDVEIYQGSEKIYTSVE
jgi:hypothetical protein